MGSRYTGVMAAFHLTKTKDVHYLHGGLTEALDLSPLVAAADVPLKLNLGAVTQINSVGTRTLGQFFKDLGARPLELHELPGVLVELLNVFPQVFNGRQDAVQSLYAPYLCDSCQEKPELLLRRQELKVTTRGVTAPLRTCRRCATPMALAVEPDDYFLFLL